MSNYKKFSLDTIKQKLKNGEYAARVGAMRAIGKAQELSEADKTKARAMVDKYFGTESVSVTKPKAKKAAKKAAKAAAPKQAKTAAPKKKKAVKKVAPSPAAKAAPKAALKKAVRKASKKAEPAAAAPEDDTDLVKELTKPAPVPSSKGAVITEMSAVISTVSESLKAMEAAKRMFPKASLEQNVEMVTGAMTRAVRVIDEEVTKPRLGESPGLPAAKAAAPVRKKTAKKGTRAKVHTTPPPSEEAVAESDQPNGVHEEGELSEEEQEQLRLARETQAQAD